MLEVWQTAEAGDTSPAQMDETCVLSRYFAESDMGAKKKLQLGRLRCAHSLTVTQLRYRCMGFISTAAQCNLKLINLLNFAAVQQVV